jgi:hypothetical protein
MITARQLQHLMKASPFKPFRVHLTDGTSYDILNHDSAFVEQTTFDIGLNPNADGIAEDLVRYAILQITRLEDISHKQAA